METPGIGVPPPFLMSRRSASARICAAIEDLCICGKPRMFSCNQIDFAHDITPRLRITFDYFGTFKDCSAGGRVNGC